MPTYLEVSFADKDEAKRLGARWDAASRRWYVPDFIPVAPFARWLPAAVQSEDVLIAPIYLRRSTEACYMRIPRDPGHRSAVMVDSIPA